MSFVALMRNPSSGALFAIVNAANEQVVKEWKTRSAAKRAMNRHFYAKAWGYQVIEVDGSTNAKGVEHGETLLGGFREPK